MLPGSALELLDDCAPNLFLPNVEGTLGCDTFPVPTLCPLTVHWLHKDSKYWWKLSYLDLHLSACRPHSATRTAFLKTVSESCDWGLLVVVPAMQQYQ